MPGSTGSDGSVWSLRPDGLFRLGSADTHEFDQVDIQSRPRRDAVVRPDGTLWWSNGRSLYTLDPSAPDIRRVELGSRKGYSIKLDSDGTVWATWITGAQRLRVGRIEDGKWVRAQADEVPGRQGNDYRLVAAPDGSVGLWLHGLGGLHRLDGSEWLSWQQLEPAHDDDVGFEVLEAEVGPDATLWALLRTPNGSSTTLARLDDAGWQQWNTDEVPFPGDHFGGEPALLEVAPDGSVWFGPYGARDEHVFGCDGVASFDGDELRYHLRDLCVFDLEIVPNGAVWVLAGTYGGQTIIDENGGRFPSEPLAGPVRTYVIQPGAPADG